MSDHTKEPWKQSPHWNPHGGRVVMIGDRYVQLGKRQRVRAERHSWGYVTKITIRYLDTGKTEYGPIGKTMKRVKPIRTILAALEGKGDA